MNLYRRRTDEPKEGIKRGLANLRGLISSLSSHKPSTSQHSTSALMMVAVSCSETLAHSQNTIRHNNPEDHIQIAVKTSNLTNRK
jgi:hypothetical protein